MPECLLLWFFSPSLSIEKCHPWDSWWSCGCDNRFRELFWKLLKTLFGSDWLEIDLCCVNLWFWRINQSPLPLVHYILDHYYYHYLFNTIYYCCCFVFWLILSRLKWTQNLFRIADSKNARIPITNAINIIARDATRRTETWNLVNLMGWNQWWILLIWIWQSLMIFKMTNKYHSALKFVF